MRNTFRWLVLVMLSLVLTLSASSLAEVGAQGGSQSRLGNIRRKPNAGRVTNTSARGDQSTVYYQLSQGLGISIFDQANNQIRGFGFAPYEPVVGLVPTRSGDLFAFPTQSNGSGQVLILGDGIAALLQQGIRREELAKVFMVGRSSRTCLPQARRIWEKSLGMNAARLFRTYYKP